MRVSFSSHGLCGSKHPACAQPRMTMGSDMDRTAQTPGMATWAPRPSATQTEVKQYHLGPALEPHVGGRQEAVPHLTRALGSLPFPTIHPQITLSHVCLSTNATQTQGQKENNPQFGEPATWLACPTSRAGSPLAPRLSALVPSAFSSLSSAQ